MNKKDNFCSFIEEKVVGWMDDKKYLSNHILAENI
jgi:hypothetical protein